MPVQVEEGTGEPDPRPDDRGADSAAEARGGATAASELERDGGNGGVAPARRSRPLRSRALDWLIGALAMLLIIALAIWLFWMSVSRDADEVATVPTTSANDPSRVPTGALVPPEDLGDDQVWLGNVSLTSSTLIAAATPLHDVRGSGREVRSTEDGITAGWVRLTGTVPFPVVAEEMGSGTVLERVSNEQVRVRRDVELMGRRLDVIAEGTVRAVDGQLVMQPTRISIPDAGFLDGVLTNVARAFVTIEHDIEGLPEGLVVQHVDIGRDGFRATLEGTDVVITQPR